MADTLLETAARVDVIETAGRIIANPRRATASTADVLALAHAAEKFWSLAIDGEILARPEFDRICALDRRIIETSQAITTQMAALRGGESEEQHEHNC